MLHGSGVAAVLDLVRSVVDTDVERYVRQYCTVVGQSREGYTIYGCESGIFARAGSNQMNFEYHLGLEWFQRCHKTQFGEWMFYSAEIQQVRRLLLENGINISAD